MRADNIHMYAEHMQHAVYTDKCNCSAVRCDILQLILQNKTHAWYPMELVTGKALNLFSQTLGIY